MLNPTMMIVLRRLLHNSPPSTTSTHGGASILYLSAYHHLRTHHAGESQPSTHQIQSKQPVGYTSDSSSTSKLLLYSYWQSSCSWRVRFALNLKGLSYEYKAVNLASGEQYTPEFEKLNPLHMVPVLADGDVVISDSYAILLYLEEKYPQKALLPAEPKLRALNLQAAGIVSSNVQPLHMLSVLKHIEDKFGPEQQRLWAEHYIEKGFLALEKLLEKFAGRYACGEEPLLADVFLAPQIAVAAMRFNIDMSKYPTLQRIYESCKALPEFQASVPQRQPDAAD